MECFWQRIYLRTTGGRENKEGRYRTNRTVQYPKAGLVNHSEVAGAGRARSREGTPGADTYNDTGRKLTQSGKESFLMALTSQKMISLSRGSTAASSAKRLQAWAFSPLWLYYLLIVILIFVTTTAHWHACIPAYRGRERRIHTSRRHNPEVARIILTYIPLAKT